MKNPVASSQESQFWGAPPRVHLMNRGAELRLNEKFCEDVVGAVRRMVGDGYDPKKSWTTALFFTDGSPVRDVFNHKRYGAVASARVKPDFALFYEHVVRAPTTWFSGTRESKPKDRMLQRARDIFDEWNDFSRPAVDLVRDALLRLTLCFAHDMRCATKKKNSDGKAVEGGPKMFFMASPWQILNAIPRGLSDKDKSIEAIDNIIWPGSNGFDERWLSQGQPVLPYPSCSVYASRVDETLPHTSKREYFMQIDVDGINALTAEQEKKQGKKVRDELCERVIEVFQQESDSRPSMLARLSGVIKQTFQNEWNATASISWHRTIGFKPSWRAYVVGRVFQDNYEAKMFVADRLQEECESLFREHLPEPFKRSDRLSKIIDCGTFSDGWDRCLGSAKLSTRDPQQMRFLSVQPLTAQTDEALMDIFNECPNRYILTVLGWIYPERVLTGEVGRDELVVKYRTDVTRPKKGKASGVPPQASSREKRVKCGDSRDAHEYLTDDQTARLSRVVSDSFERHGLVHPTDAGKRWKGELGALKVMDGQEYLEIQAAASEFMLCAYRNCAPVADSPRRVVPTILNDAAMHSPDTSAGKINYQISLKDDQEPWIRQNCFKCGGQYGFKMQYLCPVVLPPGVRSLREYALGEVEKESSAHEDPGESLFGILVPNVRVVVDGAMRKLCV